MHQHVSVYKGYCNKKNFSSTVNSKLFLGCFTMSTVSFISNIYIAPLQGNYSEALLNPARLQRRVLRREKNVRERVLGKGKAL